MYNNALQEALQQLNNMGNKPRRTLKEQRTGNFNINSKINDDRRSAHFILNDILEEETEHYKYLVGNSVPGFSTLSNLKIEKIIPTAYSWGVAGVANLDNPKLIYVSMGFGSDGGTFAEFGKDGIEKLQNIFVNFGVGGSGTLIKLNNNSVNIPCDIRGSCKYEIKYSNENGPLVTWKDAEEVLKSEIKNCIDKYEQGELDMNNLLEVYATVNDNDVKTISSFSKF